jgi:peptidoglycan/xylan/chitin deacetylase (PgdA/CDA1 family)
MKFLARCCVVASPSRLCAAHDSNRSACAVAITVDDGHVSALDIAAPALHELGFDAAFFIPTDAIGKPGQLAKSGIRALSDAGFEIGSHSCSHRSLTSLSVRDCMRETVRSRHVLEDITGRAVAMFAYPFGTRADFNVVTERVLEKAGYRWAFTSQHAPLSRTTHPLRIPRLKIERHDSLEMFERIIAGGVDAWQWVDEHLWWLQRGAHRRSASWW